MSTETQPSAPQERPKNSRRLIWRGTILCTLAAITALSWRAYSPKTEASVTQENDLPVAVVKAQRENLAKELIVQAEFRPFQEVDLHSKVTGFLEKINVDIGDQVAAGQVLAVLEIPELQDDLKRARAIEQRSMQEVNRAESVYLDAHLSYERLVAVNKAKSNLIAQQELDTASAKDREAASALAAAKEQVQIARAETSKLNTMAQYSQLTAPFSGAITKRSVDPGALIMAGITSGAQTMPLLRLSQLDRLRLVFPVSMSYVSQVDVGTPVEVRVQNQPKILTGKIARITRKIETTTRTMDVELDVPNPDLKLIPGMYASVVIKLEQRDHTLALPIQAVARGQKPTVFVVNAKNEIEERSVKIGLETPTKLEILEGVKEGDQVMIGSRTQVKPGQKVVPKMLESEKE
jgi:RND family efflux transporter MFP subunit